MYVNGTISVEPFEIANMVSISIKNAGIEVSRLINVGNMTPEQMFIVVENNIAKKLKIELDREGWQYV